MRQRLAIAAALLTPRDLLVLDEPTNGLDPQGTREVRSLISSLAADGATVLVSSHLLSEVEQICSHLGVMRQGRLVAQGSVGEVRAGLAARGRGRRPWTPETAADVLRELGLTDVTVTARRACGHAGRRRVGGDRRQRWCAAAWECGASSSRRPSLEDLFVALTGEGFDVSR